MTDGNDFEWKRDRLDLIKRTVCPKGITDDEFALFVEQCKRSGLDPLLREAFCVPRRQNTGNKDRPNWVEKREFQPSESGMLTRAERMADFMGVQASAVYAEDDISVDAEAGVVHHRYNPAKRKGALVGAWARVQRREKLPTLVWLDFAAYAQSTPLWSTKPATMIEKCARVAALRKAYPSQFGGLYIAGERPDDVETEDAEPVVQAETLRPPPVPALPEPGPRETLVTVPVKEGVTLISREPGEDDDSPADGIDRLDMLAESICSEAGMVATEEERKALCSMAEELPAGSEQRKRAVKALNLAKGRLMASGAKGGGT